MCIYIYICVCVCVYGVTYVYNYGVGVRVLCVCVVLLLFMCIIWGWGGIVCNVYGVVLSVYKIWMGGGTVYYVCVWWTTHGGVQWSNIVS